MSIAVHARFFRAGDSFTVPSNGTASATAKPGSADTGWLDLGVIETWEISHTDEDEKVIWAPSPGRLLKRDVLTTKQGLQIKLTANELTPQALEHFFRTSENLSTSSASFTPLGKVPRKGWLELTSYNQEDAGIINLTLWVRIKVTGGVKGGNGELIMPEFTADVLYSALNSGQIV
jgi:hypothetical protein